MQSSIRRISVVLAAFVFAVLSFGAAQAQTNSTIGTMNVPFAFEFNSHPFAAGQYRIIRIGEWMVAIQGKADSGMGFMASAYDRTTVSDNRLVFDKVGAQYFLRKVVTAGQDLYLECPKSKAEKQAVTLALAANQTKVETVQVAAAR